jgi:hypothetical protein
MNWMGFGGTVTKTSSDTVGTSGKPIRIYSATWLSGGTAGNLALRNGTTTAATLITSIAGAANRTVTQNFEGGLLFPSGCYLSLDHNTTSATFSYIVEA